MSVEPKPLFDPNTDCTAQSCCISRLISHTNKQTNKQTVEKYVRIPYSLCTTYYVVKEGSLFAHPVLVVWSRMGGGGTRTRWRACAHIRMQTHTAVSTPDVTLQSCRPSSAPSASPSSSSWFFYRIVSKIFKNSKKRMTMWEKCICRLNKVWWNSLQSHGCAVRRYETSGRDNTVRVETTLLFSPACNWKTYRCSSKAGSVHVRAAFRCSVNLWLWWKSWGFASCLLRWSAVDLHSPFRTM